MSAVANVDSRVVYSVTIGLDSRTAVKPGEVRRIETLPATTTVFLRGLIVSQHEEAVFWSPNKRLRSVLTATKKKGGVYEVEVPEKFLATVGSSKSFVIDHIFVGQPGEPPPSQSGGSIFSSPTLVLAPGMTASVLVRNVDRFRARFLCVLDGETLSW